MLVQAETLNEAATRLGLAVTAKFVPFSKSRSKDQDQPNLNWVVTLTKDGRHVIDTEYSAGQGHCPAYKLRKQPKQDTCWPLRFDQVQRSAIAMECETGKVHVVGYSGRVEPKSAPILPNEIDVIYSLIADASVLDYRNFDEWASEYGYDSDSLKALAIYDACLDIALAVRSGLGEKTLAVLQTASQDY